MTWKSITEEEFQFARHMIRWMEIARNRYGDKWIPSEADVSKSALLERLRNGLEPLPEPPPLGFSCPWYAVVEDPGPHYVFEVHVYGPDDKFFANTIGILQHTYEIVDKLGETEYIVRSGNGSSYKFHLWFDPKWEHPNNEYARKRGHQGIIGGWFMQNVDFSK